MPVSGASENSPGAVLCDFLVTPSAGYGQPTSGPTTSVRLFPAHSLPTLWYNKPMRPPAVGFRKRRSRSSTLNLETLTTVSGALDGIAPPYALRLGQQGLFKGRAEVCRFSRVPPAAPASVLLIPKTLSSFNDGRQNISSGERRCRQRYRSALPNA